MRVRVSVPILTVGAVILMLLAPNANAKVIMIGVGPQGQFQDINSAVNFVLMNGNKQDYYDIFADYATYIEDYSTIIPPVGTQNFTIAAYGEGGPSEGIRELVPRISVTYPISFSAAVATPVPEPDTLSLLLAALCVWWACQLVWEDMLKSSASRTVNEEPGAWRGQALRATLRRYLPLALRGRSVRRARHRTASAAAAANTIQECIEPSRDRPATGSAAQVQ